VVWLRVLSRKNLSYPSRHSTANSRPFNRLQPLCSPFSAPVLCFQSLAASFPKTPGVRGTEHPAKEANPERPLVVEGSQPFPNSVVSYHILVNPLLSCNYALFCATASQQAQRPQSLAHSFYRHGGGTPHSERSREGPLHCAPIRSAPLSMRIADPNPLGAAP